MSGRLVSLVVVCLLVGCTRDPEPIVLAVPPVRLQPLKDRIPTHVLSCRNEPTGAGVVTTADAANYIVELQAAGRDCRHKLGTVRGIIESEK